MITLLSAVARTLFGEINFEKNKQIFHLFSDDIIKFTEGLKFNTDMTNFVISELLLSVAATRRTK